MRFALWLVTGSLVATTRVVAAQQSARVSGTISGSVIDATSAVALANATVTLTPDDGLGLLTTDRRSTPSFSLSRSTTTAGDGDYRFTGLPIGTYHLYVQRVGYVPASVDIELAESKASPVSVGLVVVPVRLRAMEIRATDSAASQNARLGNTPERDRIAAARARQNEFLSTDTRELTTADVVEGATLGGSDVFRALERLPGVTQLDDWSAKLWVRGNRWDESRVYYDDLPLFDPLQSLGRGAGVSADAIGGAFLHPGVRPVSVGGEGAARIDLRSRPAIGDGDWRGATQLTVYGLSGVVERERKDQTGGFVLSADHSLGGWFGRAPDYLSIDPAVDDAQVVARGDLQLGGGRRIESSALITRDDRVSAAVSIPEMQSWGNAAGRVTFVQPLGTLAATQTFGMTHFSSDLQDALVQVPNTAGFYSNPTFSPVLSSVDYVLLSGKLGPARFSSNGWTLGYDLINQRSAFGGMREHLLWSDLSTDRITRSDALSYASAWGDRRVSVGEHLSIEGGLRVDAGGSGLSSARPAPTLQARYALTDRTSISAGAGRTYQYVQSLDLPNIAQGQPSPGLWLTSGNDVPLMAVDNGMIGIEHWASGAVLLAANAYLRRTTGAIIGDPTPGALIDRPLFVTSNERAHGVEISARKLAGRVTGLVAYTYARATTSSEGLTFLSPTDRTHAVDATAMLRAGNFRFGAAFAWTSGAPYTRSFFGRMDGQADAPSWTSYPSREAPNALRAPNYASLDVFTDYTRTIGATSLSVSFGIQNLTGRTNRTWFEASGLCANDQFSASAEPGCRNNDLFQAPVAYQPTFGLRLAF